MKLFGILFIILMLLAACRPTPVNQPPTATPRPTDLPPPTLGYATLAPGEVTPTVAVATAIAPFDLDISSRLQQFEGDRLSFHVTVLQDFYTRHVNSSYTDADQGIGAAYLYILNQFQNIKAESQGRFVVTSQEFPLTSNGVRTNAKNVIGFIPGTEVGGGVIVIGAHYDTRVTNLDDGTSYAPGANDNGSGVAAVIELARVMSQQQYRSSVMFVAFTAEEIGRIGSKHFVEEYIKFHNIPVTAMINLDIIGSTTNREGAVNDYQIRVFAQGPDDSPSRQLARAAQFIARKYPGTLAIDVQEAEDRTGAFSDHLSFSEAGYAAIRFTEMNEEPERRHTERDTIDDVQFGYLLKATQTIYTVAVVLADGPRPPGEMVLRDNTDGTQRLVWDAVPDAASYIVVVRPSGSAIYQEFETEMNYVDWDGFERFISLAIAPKDAAGEIGPPSTEYAITP